MEIIEFDAIIVDGKIEIPIALRAQIPNQVHLTLSSTEKQHDPNSPSILRIIESGEFLMNDFRPLSREEAHER